MPRHFPFIENISFHRQPVLFESINNYFYVWTLINSCQNVTQAVLPTDCLFCFVPFAINIKMDL